MTAPLSLDFDDDDVPMHDAPLERQASVAASEGKLLVNAFEGSVPVPPPRIQHAMRAEGVVAVDNVLDAATADELRTHVNARLTRELLQDQDATNADGERLLGQIMCRSHRWDLKLDLADPVVNTAVEQMLASFGGSLVSLLGHGARLFELGALAVDEGAPRQPVHPDTPFSSAISVVTVLVALQDVALDMGPTHFIPRTHTERARAAQWGYDPTDDEEVAELLTASACRIPLPRKGDAVAFDARTLHCGSAHTAKHGSRRILLYCSFMRRRGCKDWHGAGFDQPGTLLNRLRGKLCLSDSGKQLVEVTTAPLWWQDVSAALSLVLGWLALFRALLGRVVAMTTAALPWRFQFTSRLCRGFAVVHTRGALEIRAPIHSRSSRFERLGVLHRLLPEDVCSAFVAFARDAPATAWRVDRHERHATTDIEIDAVAPADARAPPSALEALDRALDESGAIETVLDSVAVTYRVERRLLLLRELFVVRYEPGGQASLGTHRDSSWFSFVIALNDSTADFTGGGTSVRGAPPLSVDARSCLFFVGVQPHAAAPVTRGTRLVLTGFIDMRAPLLVRNACTAQMLAFDGDFVCSSCREFRRPHLRSNVRMLERCAGGKRGRQLLQLLAARRLAVVPCDVDLTPVEEACRRHLAGEPLADAAMRKFVSRVLERA